MKTPSLITIIISTLHLLAASLSAQTPSAELIRLSNLVLPTVCFSEATVSEVIDFFEAKSRDLDPKHTGLTILADGSVRASTAKITMDVTDVTLGTAIRFFAILAGLEAGSVEDAVRLRISPNPRAPLEERKPSPRIEARMSVVFPSVQFNNATLEECVEFIRAKGKDLDPANGNVSLMLKSDGLSPNAKSITLNLKNITWIKTLRYIAELADADLICLGEGYLLRAKVK